MYHDAGAYADVVGEVGSLFDRMSGGGGGGGGGYLEQALAQSRVKAWASDPFTADLCESILPAGFSYGEFCSAFKRILLALLPNDLSEGQRQGVLKTIHALERSENIFRRREQHLAWHLPFHMSRVVDETCKQLHNSNVGEMHIFPFQFAGPTVCVVNHVTVGTFDVAIICVNPTESTFLPFSTEKPPKLLVQSVLEVNNVPKKKITSEAFWAIELVAGHYDDAVVATHIVPWLNNKPIADLVRDTRDPCFATGSKNDSGNVWKSFVHAFKYIAKTQGATKQEIKACRVMVKKFFLERALEDLGTVEHVDHSTRLIIRSALQNSSLCLARNAQCVSEDLFRNTRKLIDNVADKMKELPSTDEASTAPPPELDLDKGWDKHQHPEQFPFCECLRRLENVDHFVGTAVEQPRYVPVNFFNVPEKVSTLDEALYALEMTLHVTNRIINQQAVVRRAPFIVVAFLSRVFLELLPVPLGPKSRQRRQCLWHPESGVRYGQQLHLQRRLWHLCEIFVWASFGFRSTKEFDAQRITVLGAMCSMSDASIRQLATDQPSMVSKHIRGHRRKAAFGVQTGRYAQQTEHSVSYNPAINITRCAILDYHNEVCEDIPPTNIMFPWEDGWNMCKATQAMFRQLATVEGLPVSQAQGFFACEEAGNAKVIPSRYYNEYRIFRDLYVVFKCMMGGKAKLPTCTHCLTCCVPAPQITTETRGATCTVRVKWMHSDRFAKAVHLRFPSYSQPSKFTTPFESSNEDDILHIKNLPSFDDAMGQRDAELLLSYLTTPYIRIPLVLNFFATEDRVSCLSNGTVRNILESVLFEPCSFLAHTLDKQVPTQVPSENPALIATAQGILFNEAQFSPKGLIDPLVRLVALGREMDAGTVQNTQVVDLILFLVRIASRVDNYLTKYVRLAEEYKQSKGVKEVRGLHFEEAEMREAQQARVELHKITVDVFIPMMESWVNELMDNLQNQGVRGSNVRIQSRQIDMVTRHCSNLYAHILIVLRNLDAKEMSPNSCSLILSSMVFISTRYNPGIYTTLDVSDAELYDAVELQRREVARWLQSASPADVSYVMDSVVRVATSTGKRTEGHSFKWGLVAGQDCIGRYTRVDNVRSNASDSKRPHLEKDLVEAFGDNKSRASKIHKDMICINEGDHDVEINLQTFSLTFKAAHLIALPSNIATHPDLQAVFSSSAKLKSQIPSMQCAVVQDAEHRMWVRLVGQEMDVQRWNTSDPRIPLPEQEMRFFPDDLAPTEEWIYKLVEPVRETYFIRGFMQPPIFLLLPKERCTQDQCVITIAAVCSRTGEKLKEVVAFRDFKTVHVYDIVSIGRRWYRKLLYTTNAYYCLRQLQPSVVDRFAPWKKWARHAAGDFDPDARTEPNDTVNVVRHPTHPQNVSKAIETFIPSRLLWGLIPDALLEQYEFWQDPDDQLRGYPRRESSSDDDSSSGSGAPTHILWLHWREIAYDPFCSYHEKKQITYKIIRFAKKTHCPKVSERAVLVSQRWEAHDDADDELERMRTADSDGMVRSTSRVGGDGDGDGDGSSSGSSSSDEEGEQPHETMGMYRMASAVELEEKHAKEKGVPVEEKKEVASIEDLDLLLINLMYAREGTPLHSLAKLLARIELLSHVLCWTTQVNYDFMQQQQQQQQQHPPLTIDLIQLPRLKLTFAAKIDSDGVCRLYSLDHAHLFVSNLRPELVTQQLLQGMPHSIILGDSCDNLSILVPALHVVRPTIQNSPFSTELVVNRANRPWYQKLDTKYYLFPVHVSLSFLFTQTLASALYLIALRFLHCEYEDVFRLASTIGTDMRLTDEEEQNFKLLAVRDNRHEAIACRVKIGLLVSDSPVDLLWYLPSESAKMIRSYSSIGLSCRLSVTEERRLLQVCLMTMQKVKIVEDATKPVDNDVLLRFVPHMVKCRSSAGAGLSQIYMGMSSSETKAIKEMYSEISTQLREQLDLRISREEVWRIFLIWWNQRKQPIPDFYRCLLVNRESFLTAEAKAVEAAEKNGDDDETSQPSVQAKMILPEREKDERWAYYRDYDVMSCKLPSAQEVVKNDADRVMKLSDKFDYFYCGQEARKSGTCRCRNCDDATCGPHEGCSCLACEKWNKKNLDRMRFLPAKIGFSQQRVMSFFDANNWIEDVIGNYCHWKTWKRNVGTVHPTVIATTSNRCASLRTGSSNFMRMYELLTGTTKCRIGSADSAKDMVTLLFPLCNEARRPEAALGHLTHYLLNNPQVLPKLPKANKFAKEDSSETKVAKVYSAIFQHAANDCRYPPAPPAERTDEYERSISTQVVPRPARRSDPLVPILATRLLPTLSDNDRSSRTWRPTDLAHLQIVSDEERKELETITDEVRTHLRTQPLSGTVPAGFVKFATRTDLGDKPVSNQMPFDLRKHEAAATSVAKSMISRLEQDLEDFAKAENGSRVPRLDGLCPASKAAEVVRAGGEPVAALRVKLEQLVTALSKLRESDGRFTSVAFQVIERTVNGMPIGASATGGGSGSRGEAIMHLRRLADQEAKMNLTYIISCLCSASADTHWMQLNPFLTPETIEAVMSLTTSTLLRANRVGHANRASESARELINLLKKVEQQHTHFTEQQRKSQQQRGDEEHLQQHQQHHTQTMNSLITLIEQKADSLAGILATKRVYIDEQSKFDPRFLLFEYTWNLVLRSRQRQLIGEIYQNITVQKNSIVKQMIMGAGKTTVVGPLLAMMLADSKNLVVQVVPPALLDFTRSVLRATFSCVVQKQIFCFIADRASDVDSEVIGKFLHARDSRGIVVTTPSSIKSVFLKMLEGMDRVEDISRKPYPGQDREVRDVAKLLEVWQKDGVLIMDEVDLLLHPLKSELNFPIGAKHEIDFAPLRWKLPVHLIDAVFFATTGHMSTGVKETPENVRILRDISTALQLGLATNCLQGTPHTTLLNVEFYEKKLKRLFAEWSLLFLKAHHFSSGGANPEDAISDEELIRYVSVRPSKKIDPRLNEKVEKLEPDHIKTLNLIYDWVSSFLPHCLQKIDRVSFGIMNSDDMTRAREEHPNMPKSRFVTAIPFIGKDLPSSSSEFAHPDVVIGLTILAYRLEGLRQIDYVDIMRQVFAAVEKEVGRFSQRRTNVLYNRWVTAAGGKIISSFSYSEAEKERDVKKKKDAMKRRQEEKNRRATHIKVESRNEGDDDEEVGMQPSESMMSMMGDKERSSGGSAMGSRAASGAAGGGGGGDDDEGGGMMGTSENSSSGTMMGSTSFSAISTGGADHHGSHRHHQHQHQHRQPRQVDILPLRLMKQANKEESSKLFKLFRRCPEVIHWYLCNTVFPNFMRHQLTKLSASGQELGGNILFQRRIGFSGTPSDLLPVELGRCDYEPGTDGKLIHTLTNPVIMDVTRVERDWTVRSLLDFIATASPPYHALIDTGALITGMSNLQVAQYLLKNGLPTMEGVVFLDEFDRKMILVRATGRVLKLAECGIPKVKRFAVYDQVHTTGMDIDHTPNAVAIQTLGKDMTFRDFSQGAYRMRGIGQGQRVDVLIIPEVYDLIQRTVSPTRHHSDGAGAATAAKHVDPHQQQHHPVMTRTASGGAGSVVVTTGEHSRQLLLDVSTWLLVNSIRSEHVQHNQLCLQTISNVWRKEAFRQLKQAEAADEFILSSSTSGGKTINEAGGTTRATNVKAETVTALGVYREAVDYAVATFVPQPRMFSEAIQSMVDANDAFIVGDSAKAVVGDICGLTKKEDEIDNPVIDVQMVQEQEEEREQEEEKQKEHEIEMEKFVDLAYSRDDEAPTPWALSSLKDLNLASQFYSLSDFRLHKRRPLAFPDSIFVSRNFFNPKWSGQRRIKNSIVTLEWLPDAGALSVRDQPHLDYGCIDSARQEAAIGATLNILRALEGPFTADIVRDFAKIALGTEAKTASSEQLWAEMGSQLAKLEQEVAAAAAAAATSSTDNLPPRQVIGAAVQLFLKLLRSNDLRREERGRYSVVVTLSEAETLRRIIHLKKVLKQPVVVASTPQQQEQGGNNTNNTQLALRMVPAGNRIMDQTYGFRESSNCFQRDRNYQAVRFFDGDLHYLDADLSLLLRAIHSSPQRVRQTFFLQTLSCRRRARQRWENSPVALAFNLQDAFSWLHQKTLGLCLRRALERRDMHLSDAFVAINNSQSGKLTPDEVWGAFRFCGMSDTTASDVLDFVQVADTHHEGCIHYSDFLSILTGSSEIDDDDKNTGGGGGGMGRDERARLPVIDPYGAQELTELNIARAKQRRAEEQDASQALASEERAIREEMERETIKEELSLIQTSTNPLFDEAKQTLFYSLREAKPPKLSQFFGQVDTALLEDTPDDTVKSGAGIGATNHPELAHHHHHHDAAKKIHRHDEASASTTAAAGSAAPAATSTTAAAAAATPEATAAEQKQQQQALITKEEASITETGQAQPFFGLCADGGMRLVARSVKLLNNSSGNSTSTNNSSATLKQYGLTMEFRVPLAKNVGKNKVKLRKLNEVMGASWASGLPALQFSTRVWSLSPSVSRGKAEDDEEAAILAARLVIAFEASDSDQDKPGHGDSDDDDGGSRLRSGYQSRLTAPSGRQSFLNKLKVLNYIFKETNPAKEHRLRRLKIGSSFEESKSCKRLNTTLGGDSYEWMKVSRPVSGWVVFQLNGIQMLVRERISLNLMPEGLVTVESSFPKDGGIADLPPTVFSSKKGSESDSDDDTSDRSWWSSWDAYMSFFSNTGDGNDDADDSDDDKAGAAVDLGDIGDLMSEIRRKKELKAGDKVRRNPADWAHGDQDGGDGVVGRVIKSEQGSVSVLFPNGNKVTCLWGTGGKFELIKVQGVGAGGGAGGDDDKYFGREVENNAKWAALIRSPEATGQGGNKPLKRCSACSIILSLTNPENGWMKCNVCLSYSLCLKCFRAMEHTEHSFSDLQVLSEVLKETMIMVDSLVRILPHVKEPAFGWGNAPRDGSPGTVKSVDEEAQSCVVNFGDANVNWTGALSELELLDSRHEVLSTTWLGNFYMQIPPLERRRLFKRLSLVMDESLTLPVVASKFNVGDRVKAVMLASRWYPGEIRATLPGSKYVIAFDDGHVLQDVDEKNVASLQFKIGQKVRLLRRESYSTKLPLGVSPGTTGEISSIINLSADKLRIQVKMRSGVSLTKIYFLENEVEPVQPTQWFFRRVGPDGEEEIKDSVEMPIPQSNILSLERAFTCGKPTADLYFRSETYQAKLQEMNLYSTKTKKIAAVLRREPDEPFVLQKDRTDFFDGRWHVMSLLLDNNEPRVVVDGDPVDITFNVINASRNDDDSSSDSSAASGSDSDNDADADAEATTATEKKKKKDKKTKRLDEEEETAPAAAAAAGADGGGDHTTPTSAEAKKKRTAAKREKAKLLAPLSRTPASVMQIDVREPINVLPYNDPAAAPHRSKYGPTLPNRYVAGVEVGWGPSAGDSKKAVETFKRLDAMSMWVCRNCDTTNSRLIDNCASCQKDRFVVDGKEVIRQKMRVVTNKSKEAADVRKRLHNKLRQQCQKQLEQMDETDNLSSML